MKNVLRDILALNNADYGEKKNSQLIKNTFIYKRPKGSFIKYKWQVLSWYLATLQSFLNHFSTFFLANIKILELFPLSLIT